MTRMQTARYVGLGSYVWTKPADSEKIIVELHGFRGGATVSATFRAADLPEELTVTVGENETAFGKFLTAFGNGPCP